jgi:hypothetical protein
LIPKRKSDESYERYPLLQSDGPRCPILKTTKENETQKRDNTKQDTYPANILNDKKEKKVVAQSIKNSRPRICYTLCFFNVLVAAYDTIITEPETAIKSLNLVFPRLRSNAKERTTM